MILRQRRLFDASLWAKGMTLASIRYISMVEKHAFYLQHPLGLSFVANSGVADGRDASPAARDADEKVAWEMMVRFFLGSAERDRTLS